ncbi:MAG TPA: FtsX-like permease family protein, partial [Thermoanaerobaculia bacterium]|nr:FtsX-like permease family protein [Thermoanaerobaculia bacterium]
ERTAALPGVESASLTNLVPLDFGGNNSTNVEIDGYEPAADEEMFVAFNQVGPDYLRTMGIGLVAGRDFTLRDDIAAPPAVIVNETMARRYWSGRDPVGARLRMGGRDWTVVGVARDGKYLSLGEPPQTLCYIPVLQSYRPETVILLRTSDEPLSHVQSLRQAVEGLDPNLPIAAVKSLREHLRISVFAQRLAAAFLGAFGLLALLLAALGLYSVIRYAVGQRTRERGVRAALGARPGDLGRLVLRQGMVLVLIGLAIGVAAALAVTRLLASQLLGVSVTDPLVFVAVPILLALVAALACFLPARQAAAVDPMVALRAE